MKKADKDIQMLGPQSVLEGNLVFEGTLFLNGHVKGAIESRAGAIVVGEDAVIHADVFVRTATINGEIKGTVRATERIRLHPSARLYGALNAPVVQIDAGAIFEGKCTIKPKEDAAFSNRPGAVNKRRENSKTDEIIPEVTGTNRLCQK
jgi:cytoskeletal protein CcmA (bactofilin family)